MIEKEVAQRIAILRYLLICGIVFLHLPPSISIAEIQFDFFGFIKAITSHALFRGTVPMLTCISGYLVFKAGYHLNFYKLISKKTRTILVPLILWNAPIMIALYVVQKYSLINYDFSVQAYPLTMDNWVDGLIGWRSGPINYPLNFLRDLFIVSMLAPVFALLMSIPSYIGLFIISVFFLNNLDGDFVLRDTMVVNFYIGGMAAFLSWNLRKMDRAWPICGIFLIIICILIVVLRIENRVWFALICPFLIWPIISSFQDTWIGAKLAELSNGSFVVFLSHGPIVWAMWVIYNKAGQPYPYVWFWITCPWVAIIGGHVIRWAAYRSAPSLASVAMGNR